MDDLAQWLRAQLDEDERIARRMEEHYPSPWDMSDRGWMAHVVADGPGFREVVRLEQWHGEPEDISLGQIIEHVAQHDPARVLREIDAKRQLLAIHRPYVPEPDQACLGCAGGIRFTSCPVVRVLALPYVDRPGYAKALASAQ